MKLALVGAWPRIGLAGRLLRRGRVAGSGTDIAGMGLMLFLATALVL